LRAQQNNAEKALSARAELGTENRSVTSGLRQSICPRVARVGALQWSVPCAKVRQARATTRRRNQLRSEPEYNAKQAREVVPQSLLYATFRRSQVIEAVRKCSAVIRTSMSVVIYVIWRRGDTRGQSVLMLRMRLIRPALFIAIQHSRRRRRRCHAFAALRCFAQPERAWLRVTVRDVTGERP